MIRSIALEWWLQYWHTEDSEVPPKIPSLARGMESSSPLTEGTHNAHPQTDKIRKKGQNPPSLDFRPVQGFCSLRVLGQIFGSTLLYSELPTRSLLVWWVHVGKAATYTCLHAWWRHGMPAQVLSITHTAATPLSWTVPTLLHLLAS